MCTFRHDDGFSRHLSAWECLMSLTFSLHTSTDSLSNISLIQWLSGHERFSAGSACWERQRIWDFFILLTKLLYLPTQGLVSNCNEQNGWCLLMGWKSLPVVSCRSKILQISLRNLKVVLLHGSSYGYICGFRSNSKVFLLQKTFLVQPPKSNGVIRSQSSQTKLCH